jgi:catechol 2,3-dioxygenase-like lactoylglutathione lyase family enzyme
VPTPVIRSIDHFVLTVASIEATCAFYARVLGFAVETFESGGGSGGGAERRTALTFGTQKINLHEVGREFTPRAQVATAGSGDFCLLTETPIDEVVAHLRDQDVAVELGPVAKTGATGPLTSVYFRDPDGNLVEVSNRI